VANGKVFRWIRRSQVQANPGLLLLFHFQCVFSDVVLRSISFAFVYSNIDLFSVVISRSMCCLETFKELLSAFKIRIHVPTTYAHLIFMLEPPRCEIYATF
jgi:hypothetical protein